MRRTLMMAIVLVTIVGACSTSRGDGTADQAGTTTAAGRGGEAPAAAAQPSSTTSPTVQAGPVEDTVVRFASTVVQVDVTITQDNPTTRDFLSLLPLTIAFEEFNGREKIGYPPRRLVTEGSPGHDPEDGDLIYFAAWGNLGFYYNAEGDRA